LFPRNLLKNFAVDKNANNNFTFNFGTAMLTKTAKIFYFDGSTFTTGRIETAKIFDIKILPSSVS
jgi:hypothetical protein